MRLERRHSVAAINTKRQGKHTGKVEKRTNVQVKCICLLGLFLAYSVSILCQHPRNLFRLIYEYLT